MEPLPTERDTWSGCPSSARGVAASRPSQPESRLGAEREQQDAEVVPTVDGVQRVSLAHEEGKQEVRVAAPIASPNDH